MYNYTDSLEYLGPNHRQPIQIRVLHIVSLFKTLYEDPTKSDRSAPRIRGTQNHILSLADSDRPRCTIDENTEYISLGDGVDAPSQPTPSILCLRRCCLACAAKAQQAVLVSSEGKAPFGS